jgi:hypothetical protein
LGLGIEILAPTSNFDIESILSDLEVGYQIIGSRRNFKIIRSVAAIDEATPYDLTFCSGYHDYKYNPLNSEV